MGFLKEELTYVAVRALIDDFEVEIDKRRDGLYRDQEPRLLLPELCKVVEKAVEFREILEMRPGSARVEKRQQCSNKPGDG